MLETTLASLGLAADTLAGVVAVVAHAEAGIGHEVAVALAQLGAAVALADPDEAAGRRTESIIRGQGGKVLYRPVDVADEAQVAGFAREVGDHLGQPLLLVNAAAAAPVAAVTDMALATWEGALATNLRGPFLACRAFVPGMVAAAQGTVINVVAGGSPAYLSAYHASAQGLLGLTQALAAEVGDRGLHVCALATGMVATAGGRATARALAPVLGVASDDLLDAGTPAAAAAAVAYLAAHAAGECHGQLVPVGAILERASARPASGEHVPPHEAPAPPSAERTIAARQGRELVDGLVKVMTQIDADLGHRHEPERSRAHGRLRDATGLDTVEWLRLLSDLTGHLLQVETVGANAVAALRAEHRGVAEHLQALGRYFRDEPSRAVGSGDAAAAGERQDAVAALVDALHRVQV